MFYRRSAAVAATIVCFALTAACGGRFVVPDTAEQLSMPPGNGDVVYYNGVVEVGEPVQFRGSISSPFQRVRIPISVGVNEYLNVYVDGAGQVDPKLGIYDANEALLFEVDDSRGLNPYFGQQVSAGQYQVEVTTFVAPGYSLDLATGPFTVHLWLGEPTDE